MKKIFFGLCAFAVLSVSFAQAASFSILGAGDLSGAAGTTGQLQIQYDPAPGGATFADGSIRLALNSSTPGVIKLTGATILEPAARWGGSVQVLGVTENSIGQMNAFSVGNPGLPANGTSIYATVDYTFVGDGSTTLSLAVQGEDPLYDGAQGDVSGSVSLLSATLKNSTGTTIPEPATLAMVATGMIGLVLRRRNG